MSIVDFLHEMEYYELHLKTRRRGMKVETGMTMMEAMMLLQGTILSSIDKKQFPWSKTQLNIFTALSAEGELTMKRVARYLACSQEQATRAVAPLADVGYVERRVDPANRTRVYIRLTGEGTAYLEGLKAGFESSLNSRLEEALSGEERRELLRSAESLAGLLRKVKAAEK